MQLQWIEIGGQMTDIAIPMYQLVDGQLNLIDRRSIIQAIFRGDSIPEIESFEEGAPLFGYGIWFRLPLLVELVHIGAIPSIDGRSRWGWIFGGLLWLVAHVIAEEGHSSTGKPP